MQRRYQHWQRQLRPPMTSSSSPVAAPIRYTPIFNVTLSQPGDLFFMPIYQLSKLVNSDITRLVCCPSWVSLFNQPVESISSSYCILLKPLSKNQQWIVISSRLCSSWSFSQEQECWHFRHEHVMCDNDHFIIEISSLNILVSHPIYAGSHVLTLHTLRNAFCEFIFLPCNTWIYFINCEFMNDLNIWSTLMSNDIFFTVSRCWRRAIVLQRLG